MKKIFFGSAMLAVLALVGCKKEQSQFTLDNIEQKATISGTVVYQSNLVGQSTEEVALAGVRVVASVDFSEYSSNAAKGVKQFEATTDSAGQFSIVIPTGAKEIPVKLHIDVVKTTQSGKNIYLSMKNDKSFSVKANEAKVEKIILEKDEALSECVAEGTLKGQLTYDAGTVSKEDGTKEEGKVGAAGVNVIAEVAYAKVSKKFVAKTDANGEFTFSIPVEEAGCAVEVSIEQFKGTYTEFKNNQWVSVEALYSMSAAVTVNVKGGEITPPVKLVADERNIIDETTKTQVAFKVKGKFLQVVEKPKYNSTGDKRTGTEPGTKASAYPFTIELKRTDPDGNVTYIRYAGNQANENGVYEVEVKLYDSWNVATDNIRVNIYADNSVVVNDFAHYYFAWDEDSDNFLYDPDTDYKIQRLTGLYKGGSNNVVRSATVTEKQIYFDLSMPDATLAFEPEDENAVYGVKSGDYVDGWEYATDAMIRPSTLAAAYRGYYSPVNFGQKDGADRLIYAGGIKVW